MVTTTAEANDKGNNDNNNIMNTYNRSKSTAWLLMLVGCVIFGFVINYHNLNGYNFAYSSASQSRSLLSNQPQPQPKLQLSELTRSHIQNIICPEPLFPLYDKIINNYSKEDEQEQLIPRSIHFAWIRGLSRCISQDMMEIVDKWQEQFPSYNIYFHDDIAVDALFHDNGNYWYTIFPQLREIMNSCVKFGSAMRIDIWRVLILYRYGGTWYIIGLYIYMDICLY
jgi:mannosyltransferase OCH1-like enzyme